MIPVPRSVLVNIMILNHRFDLHFRMRDSRGSISYACEFAITGVPCR